MKDAVANETIRHISAGRLGGIDHLGEFLEELSSVLISKSQKG